MPAIRKHNVLSSCIAFLAALLLLSLVATPAHAQAFNLLYSFRGGADGSVPYGTMARDSQGNLYGATNQGGSSNVGTVFELDSAGNESILETFNFTNGAYPLAGLMINGSGNLFGTTSEGGAAGRGTVFEIHSTQNRLVHTFAASPSDGGLPEAGVIRDSAGNLYGTTVSGGTSFFGTVFKLDPAGNLTILHNFTGGTDGRNPAGKLVMDSAGNLYGTTWGGGSSNLGIVFKVDPSGNETILHNFAGSPRDGQSPYAGLVLDPAGNLYGTTYIGGSTGFGTLFKIDTAGNETVVHNFVGGSTDGHYPAADLLIAPTGDLYGVASQGGPSDLGVVYKVDQAGTFSILHDFSGSTTDGALPFGGLIADRSGNLFGTTSSGGANNMGTIFRLTP